MNHFVISVALSGLYPIVALGADVISTRRGDIPAAVERAAERLFAGECGPRQPCGIDVEQKGDQWEIYVEFYQRDPEDDTRLKPFRYSFVTVDAQGKILKRVDGKRELSEQDESVLGAGKWPTSVAETVADILSRMSPEDKQRVRNTKRADLIQFHHGWGTGIRNYYGLWRGNKKLLISACGDPCHPDDASMKIIEAVWTALQK